MGSSGLTSSATFTSATGLKITTTLDLNIQNEVQKIVSEEIDKSEKLGISNGAAMVIDPTNGQVLAMVGSRDYNSDKTDGKFNVVTQALRQPGSAIKPVTYLTAIKKGYTASSMIMDTPERWLQGYSWLSGGEVYITEQEVFYISSKGETLCNFKMGSDRRRIY